MGDLSNLFTARTLLLTVVLLAILALAFSTGLGSATSEELLIEWEDVDHITECDKTTGRTFNFTIEYNGSRSSVFVRYYFDTAPTGLGMYVISQEEFDIGDDNYRYFQGKKYNGSLGYFASPALLNDTYWVNLTAYIKDNNEVSYTHQFGIIMRQFADFEIEIFNPPPNGEFTAIPPATITIRFALYNLGNGYDSFLITAEWLGIDPQWDFTIENGVNSSGYTPWLPPDIDREHPHYIDVLVFPLVAMRAHWTDTLTVTAHSKFDPSINTTPALAKFNSGQYYGFTIDAPVTHIELDRPKAQVEFIINIHNTGNGWDTFTINPVWDTELNPGFIASPKPRTIDIDSNATERVIYYIVVPDNVPKKTYFFTAEIESSSFELQPRSIHFSVEVGQFYAIEMSAMPEEQTTHNGGAIEFDVTVRNAGNGLDSIALLKAEGIPDSWLVYIQPPEVTLLQGQEANIKVLVIVPSHFAEAPLGNYIMTIPAKSSKGDASAKVDLGIEIEGFHRIEWTDEDLYVRHPYAFNPYEEDTVMLTLEIMNLGNVRDRILFNGSANSSLISVEPVPSWVDLDPWEGRVISIRVHVQREIPPGMYDIFVKASSAQDKDLVPRVAILTIEIENMDVRIPPIPTYIHPGPSEFWPRDFRVDQYENLSFKIRVENNGTVPAYPVIIRVYDNYIMNGKEVRWNFFNYSIPPISVGDRYIVGERPFTDSNLPMFWWANVSGNHTLEFQVYLDHQSNTDNDVAYLEVYVKTKPLEEPEPSEVFLITAGNVAAGVLIAVVTTVALFGIWIKIRQIKYG